jgi:hypothetical protein
MGLDFAEITIGIEEAFNVKLSDDDVAGLVCDRDITVGDLYDLLLQQMQLRDVGRYDLRLNRQLWSEIRLLLQRVTGARIDDINLPTRLEELFPLATRRAAWTELQEVSPYHVRELDYPLAVRTAGMLLAACVVGLEQFHVWRQPFWNWLAPLLLFMAAWMFSETYLKILTFCACWRNRFPSGMRTVKDLCRSILAANYAEICQSAAMPGLRSTIAPWRSGTGWSKSSPTRWASMPPK